MRWWHIVLAIFVSVPLTFIASHYLNQHSFRFRMTMEIEANGTVHSGSSIIEVLYVKGGGPDTRRWVTAHKGVVHMVDIGPHGTVMASFTYDGDIYPRKLAKVGRPVSSNGKGFPSLVDDLPLDVYNRPPEQLTSSLAKIEVPLEKLPALIWLPPGAHWQSAEAILPEEMPAVIDANVKFIRMTIEPAPQASLVDKIEPAPAWLRRLREDHKKHYILQGKMFAFHPLKIESEFYR